MLVGLGLEPICLLDLNCVGLNKLNYQNPIKI